MDNEEKDRIAEEASETGVALFLVSLIIVLLILCFMFINNFGLILLGLFVLCFIGFMLWGVWYKYFRKAA